MPSSDELHLQGDSTSASCNTSPIQALSLHHQKLRGQKRKRGEREEVRVWLREALEEDFWVLLEDQVGEGWLWLRVDRAGEEHQGVESQEGREEVGSFRLAMLLCPNRFNGREELPITCATKTTKSTNESVFHLLLCSGNNRRTGQGGSRLCEALGKAGRWDVECNHIEDIPDIGS
jgi:hypothetical protein